MTLNDVGLAIKEIQNTKSEVAKLIVHTAIKELKDLYYLLATSLAFYLAQLIKMT